MGLGLFNLITYAPTKELAARQRARLDAITSQFPCTPFEIDGSCLSAKERLYIAHTLFPKLTPDIPTHLLWADVPPHHDPLFSTLAAISDRVIISHSGSLSLSAYADAMLACAPHTAAFLDLNWVKQSAWREAIASCFSERELTGQLPHISHLTITYNTPAGPSLKSPLFLICWFAAQLQWTFVGQKNQNSFSYKDQKNRNIAIVIEKSSENSSLCIKTFEGYELIFSQVGMNLRLQVKITTPKRCELPFFLPLSSGGWDKAFVLDLFYSRPGRQYEAMLHQLALLPPSCDSKLCFSHASSYAHN